MLTNRTPTRSLFAALRPLFTPWGLWTALPRHWQQTKGGARLVLACGYLVCGTLDLLRYLAALSVVLLTLVLAVLIGIGYVAVMIVVIVAMGILGLNYYAPDGGYCAPGTRRGVF